jgi:hypothetical protein
MLQAHVRTEKRSGSGFQNSLFTEALRIVVDSEVVRGGSRKGLLLLVVVKRGETLVP